MPTRAIYPDDTVSTLSDDIWVPVVDPTVATLSDQNRRLSGALIERRVGREVTIGWSIDGGGSEITSGTHGTIKIPMAVTIQSVELVANETGSIVIDIWMEDVYADLPPTNADSITASAPPTLSSAQKSIDSTLTGWTTALPAGCYLLFNVDSVTTTTQVTVILNCVTAAA